MLQVAVVVVVVVVPWSCRSELQVGFPRWSCRLELQVGVPQKSVGHHVCFLHLAKFAISAAQQAYANLVYIYIFALETLRSLCSRKFLARCVQAIPLNPGILWFALS